MIRRPFKVIRSRSLYQTCRSVSSQGSGRTLAPSALWKAVGASVVVAAVQYHFYHQTVHNDAKPLDPNVKVKDVGVNISAEDGSLRTLVWGSNGSNLISPESPESGSLRTPTIADWSIDVAFRDFVFHDKHAACVDARGDVYQWGDGFFGISSKEASGSRKPLRTLKDKNIVSVQLAEFKIFALSSSGRIFVLSSSKEKQKAPKDKQKSLWNAGNLVSQEENIDFMEISPRQKLGWGERFVSISAGDDHLLALTSTGRAFAHPITMKANTHGQLGFRKFDVPSSTPSSSPVSSRIPVQLDPQSVLDPYAHSTSLSRRRSSSTTVFHEDYSGLVCEDSNIRFSDTLFEIPALKGIKIDQIATGGRNSFVKTTEGRVLGWGANEFGQIGLGSNVTLPAIIVPTEVFMSAKTPRTRSKCLSIAAGGDLACLVVARTDEKINKNIDVLMFGNGQWGGLGSNQVTNAQGTPTRAKNVSGLREYNDKTQSLEPIIPHSVSISPSGHVLLTLDTLSRAGPGGGGRDLVVWGTNHNYQLGNGKRSSLAVPQNLKLSDGSRFMLVKKKANVKDLEGRMWQRKVRVEQCAVAGYGGTSAVYWKIC